jgi:integrase
MPRKLLVSAKMSAAQLAALSPTGDEFDIADPALPGLILRVGPTGTKRWLFRFRWRGERPRIALGEFPQVGLAEARELALAHRSEIKRGIDPRTGARPTKTPASRAAHQTYPAPASQTSSGSGRVFSASLIDGGECPLSIPQPAPNDKTSFHLLAYEYVEYYVKPHRELPREVVRILKKDVLPYWGKRDARTITSREIIERLDTIVARGAPVMANRTAAILTQLFRFGVHRSIVASSPVSLLFAPGGKEAPRTRVLSEKELGSFLQGLSLICTDPVWRHTLMVLLLTLVRRGSLAAAKWSEFDFQSNVWKVPAENDKERRAHVVPLTDWAIQELLALKELSEGSTYVLPKRRKNKEDRPSNGQLISRSVARLRHRLAAIGIASFTPHDLRRTGRTLLSMLGTPEDIAERVLNHSRGEIVGTYDLFEFIPQKRVALEKLTERLRSLLREPALLPNAPEPIRAPVGKEATRRGHKQIALTSHG